MKSKEDFHYVPEMPVQRPVHPNGIEIQRTFHKAVVFPDDTGELCSKVIEATVMRKRVVAAEKLKPPGLCP